MHSGCSKWVTRVAKEQPTVSHPPYPDTLLILTSFADLAGVLILRKTAHNFFIDLVSNSKWLALGVVLLHSRSPGCDSHLLVGASAWRILVL